MFDAHKWRFIIMVLLLQSLSVVAQHTNLAIPFTTNYPNAIYQAGTQNWAIAQHPNGFLFFANNNGLLQFDGTNWNVFPLKNKTIARSIYIASDGKIYIGGQGEFGYFEANKTGKLLFYSLLDAIPVEYRNFTDVWEIVEWAGKIYFNASGKIYVLEEGKISTINRGKIHFIGKANGRFFFNNEQGLHELIGDNISRVKKGAQLAGKLLTGIAPKNDGSLILSSLEQGFFELNAESITKIYAQEAAFWKQHKVYCIVELDGDRIAVGTTNNGLLLLDEKGRLTHRLNKQNGLQNNNIRSLFKDKTDNLWLGLDNGIDYVAINAPFSKIIPDKQQEGTAYAARVFDSQLFLGTSSGLYQQAWKQYYDPLEESEFAIVAGSAGQVWGLDIVDNQLFLGHHESGFLVQGKELKQIGSKHGYWKAVALAQHPQHYLVGTYEGLELYKKEQDSWQFIRNFETLKESCRIMEQDEVGNIWVAHPYRGIYKIQLSDDLSEIKVKLYGARNGFPSDNQNHVFKINKELIFTGEEGIYRYDLPRDSFVAHDELHELIGEKESVQRFFEDSRGNIWFSSTRATGVLKIKDKGLEKSFTKVIYPELNQQLVRGFEFIYAYDDNNVFIGAEKGFIHFDPMQATDHAKYPSFSAAIIRVESLQADSCLLAGQYMQADSQIETAFSHKDNAFLFSYSAPDYQSGSHLRYSTKLEGYEDSWSAWTTKTEKEFTNLSAGAYRFLVKAKSMREQESEIASFSFRISPPWYTSVQAFVLYALLIAAFLAGLILIPQRRFQEEKSLLQSEQRQKESDHQAEVARREQAIVALKNQQLQNEIAYKNQELAISTMHLVQRGELIHQLKEKLNSVIKDTADVETAKKLRRINRLLDENAQLEDVWNQFAQHFDQVYVDFLKRLKEQYPDLTTSDQKLCAYLKMNLSTKEIAPLLNISIRGVEMARYRLRKKMGLDSTVNLNEFMAELSQ